eukprot:TRINITY_DN1911_c0_g1_i1.p1 TRINITY_DN1911_c0_g1~~TRINITY_DN1911_c0_g1_i1.p1  ORF type:complete len:144 (+),score=45.51 TRINITY_DN1911_c0_g1_i1:64-495(+)
MERFRWWIRILGCFELLPLAQLLMGKSVTDTAPALFPTQQSAEFHLWYGWFLVTLIVCRLSLAQDMHNKAVYRINVVLHVAEVVLFGVLFKKRLLTAISKPGFSFSEHKSVAEATMICGIVLLNAVLFLAQYRKYTGPRVKVD